MTDQTNSGAPSGAAPGGASGGDTSNTGGSFIRQRSAQMAATMQPAAQGNEPAADAGRQQQSPPAAVRHGDGMIQVGDLEYTEQEVNSAIAERAEAAARKATLPSSPDGYEIKLPDGFQAPQGVNFQFDKNDAALKSAREIAHRKKSFPKCSACTRRRKWARQSSNRSFVM